METVGNQYFSFNINVSVIEQTIVRWKNILISSPDVELLVVYL